jgi:hypothetical protein
MKSWELAFPSRHDASPIPWDSLGHSWAELERVLQRQDSSLHQRAAQLFRSHTEQKKAELLKLAQDGAPRPSGSKLDDALCRYLSVNCDEYDAVFAKQIREAAPKWFTDKVADKQRELLRLARTGTPRPSFRSHDKYERVLATALMHYMNPARQGYDAKFAVMIKEEAPHWIPKERMRAKKAELLQAAQSGQFQKRPSVRAAKNPTERRLARSLRMYTDKSSKCYDAELSARIRALAPNWFDWSERVAARREALIKYARSGAERPRWNADPAMRSLVCTLQHAQVRDPNLLRKLHKLRPDWFVHPGVIRAKVIKDDLLNLASRGEPRPAPGSKLERCLSRFTANASQSLDLAFTAQIKKAAPQWFANTADVNKAALRKLARSGARRPSSSASDPGERRLGRALCNYTTGSVFDKAFDKEIRKLRRDWFTRTQGSSK